VLLGWRLEGCYVCFVILVRAPPAWLAFLCAVFKLNALLREILVRRRKECVFGQRQTPLPCPSAMPREVVGGGGALTSCLKHEKQFLASVQWDIVLLVFCAPVRPQIAANNTTTSRENRRLTPPTIIDPISGPGLQIEAGKHTMPKSGGNKDTEAGAGGQRKRRAEEDTGSSSGGSGTVKTEPVKQGQRKRLAREGGGRELPGR
jgi:hypothetical protein